MTNHDDRVTCAVVLVLLYQILKRIRRWLGSRYFFFYFFKLLAAIFNIIIGLKYVRSLLNLSKRVSVNLREYNGSVVKISHFEP